MSKSKITFEYDYDFILIGLITDKPDFKICYLLNKNLNINLAKKEHVSLQQNKKNSNETEFSTLFDIENEESYFSFYKYENHHEQLQYIFVSNKSYANHYLIKEHANIDFFIIIEGAYDEIDTNELIKQIKQIPEIRTAYELNPNELKSKQNLLFE
jgi:hypothetical protein